MTDTLDVSGILRLARRRADLSQRELARAIGVSPAAVARAESSGRATLALLEPALATAGLRLAVLDADGEPIRPMRPDGVRDRGRRRLPAHLDPFGQWGVGLPYRADRPYPRPPGSASYVRRRLQRDLARSAVGTPADHPSRDDLLPRRSPPEPRYVEGHDCSCGPECERHCSADCECQCEPAKRRRSVLEEAVYDEEEL